MKIWTKFSVMCMLAVVIVMGSANFTKVQANSPSVQERIRAVEIITNSLFYTLNPKLKNRKIQANESGYINEWNSLRDAIDKKMKPSSQACGKLYTPGEKEFWEFSPTSGQTFDQAYNELADAVFYSRYPQMRNQVMRKPERDNWLAIRDKIYVATCGL